MKDCTVMIEELKEATRAVMEAEAMPCTCSGTALQYEGGCYCARGKAVHDSKMDRRELLEIMLNG